MAGGLGNTDLGTVTTVLGGRCLEFFKQVAIAYGGTGEKPQWKFEPKVAADIFSGHFLARRSNVVVSLLTRIVTVDTEPDGLNGRRITSVTTEAGHVIRPRIVLDATYEGALLPMAGVSFTFGREPVISFNESAAGGVASPWPINGTYNTQKQLPPGINPFWANGSLIPLVNEAPEGPPGSGDNRTQAYNYRITLTKNKANMIQPWPRPKNYDNRSFELFRRIIEASTWDIIGTGGALPGNKFDANNQLLDFAGLSWSYPGAVAAGDWAAQQAVWQQMQDLTLGLYYWLQNDASVPDRIRRLTYELGLPHDEYINTSAPHDGGWVPVKGFPTQLYVREALRLQGDFVFTQADRETNVEKQDSIGMGAYSIDVIHVSRYANCTAGGSTCGGGFGVLSEGGIQAPSFLPRSLPPFQVPFRAIIPKRSDATNLLVPVAVSSTHVGFCAIRLEPTWMVIGESAGVAAALALRENVAVQDLNIMVLQQSLRKLGQVLEVEPMSLRTQTAEQWI